MVIITLSSSKESGAAVLNAKHFKTLELFFQRMFVTSFENVAIHIQEQFFLPVL